MAKERRKELSKTENFLHRKLCMIKKQMSPARKQIKTTEPTTTNTATCTNAVINTTEKNKRTLKIVAPKFCVKITTLIVVSIHKGRLITNNVTVNNINMK